MLAELRLSAWPDVVERCFWSALECNESTRSAQHDRVQVNHMHVIDTTCGWWLLY